jgi:hypothetical protein
MGFIGGNGGRGGKGELGEAGIPWGVEEGDFLRSRIITNPISAARIIAAKNTMAT